MPRLLRTTTRYLSSLLLLAFLLVLLLSDAARSYLVEEKHAVSGLSAGGFMAVQYQVAFSTELLGAGVFAGGPYYCAEDRGATYAIDHCMTLANFDINNLVSHAQQFAQSGYIDPLNALSNHSVYLYSGAYDTIVSTAVVKGVEDFYKAAVTGMHFETEYTIKSEHCIPTINYGNPCYELKSPFLGLCHYDGVGAALSTIYGHSLQPRTSMVVNNMFNISQAPFLPKHADPISVDSLAFVYVPTVCQQQLSQVNSTRCRIHVALHGCNQGVKAVGDDFYMNAGYNEWAEANNMIVLYPQVEATPGNLSKNPQGCFDWWGYSGVDFAWKSGSQMSLVHNLVTHLSDPSVVLH